MQLWMRLNSIVSYSINNYINLKVIMEKFKTVCESYINENKVTKQDIMIKLIKDKFGVDTKPSEAFDKDSKNGIWLYKNEGDAKEQLVKYGNTADTYRKDFLKFVKDNGYFVEWYDSGTPLLYPATSIFKESNDPDEEYDPEDYGDTEAHAKKEAYEGLIKLMHAYYKKTHTDSEALEECEKILEADLTSFLGPVKAREYFKIH